MVFDRRTHDLFSFSIGLNTFLISLFFLGVHENIRLRTIFSGGLTLPLSTWQTVSGSGEAGADTLLIISLLETQLLDNINNGDF